jgi:2-oxoglutarate ferredoxin oxidoreductase subunit gamma
MINEILFSGFGGQGLVTGALAMAYLCLQAGMNVTNMPQYGAEQRGGAASSDTKFAPLSEDIYDPRLEHPNVLISMNEYALAQHGKICRPGAIVLFNTDMGSYDASLYPDLKCYGVPSLTLGDQKAGSPRSANFVMLGAAIKLTAWFERDFCAEQIEAYFKNENREKLIASNVKAFDAGYEYSFREKA